MDEKLDDKTLIRLMKGGCDEMKYAANWIAEKSGWRIKIIKSLNPGNKISRIEDIRNDAFVDGLIAMVKSVRDGKYEARSNIKTYLESIVVNKFLDAIKKETTYIHSITELSEEVSYSHIEKEEEQIEKESTIQDIQVNINLKLMQLDEKCRSIVIHKYMKEFEISSIAELVKLKKQSVKNKIPKCREKLRKLIESDIELMKKIKGFNGRL